MQYTSDLHYSNNKSVQYIHYEGYKFKEQFHRRVGILEPSDDLFQVLHFDGPLTQTCQNFSDVATGDRIVIHKRPGHGFQQLPPSLWTISFNHHRRIWRGLFDEWWCTPTNQAGMERHVVCRLLFANLNLEWHVLACGICFEVTHER